MRHSFLYILYNCNVVFAETGVNSMCCQKLVIAQKYSAEVRPNFGTRSAKTSASAEHYNGMFGHLFCTYLYQYSISARIC